MIHFIIDIEYYNDTSGDKTLNRDTFAKRSK